MIRTKNNFKPAKILSNGSGTSDNDNVVDGVIALSAVSDKVTISAVNAASVLNQPSPFVGVPEVVEGSET